MHEYPPQRLIAQNAFLIICTSAECIVFFLHSTMQGLSEMTFEQNALKANKNSSANTMSRFLRPLLSIYTYDSGKSYFFSCSRHGTVLYHPCHLNQHMYTPPSHASHRQSQHIAVGDKSTATQKSISLSSTLTLGKILTINI